MPTKDSKVRGVRIRNETIKKIMERCAHRNWTFNRWMNWAVTQGLRSHTRRSKVVTQTDVFKQVKVLVKDKGMTLSDAISEIESKLCGKLPKEIIAQIKEEAER